MGITDLWVFRGQESPHPTTNKARQDRGVHRLLGMPPACSAPCTWQPLAAPVLPAAVLPSTNPAPCRGCGRAWLWGLTL